MQSDTFKTITAISEGFYKDKGSRFLAFAMPVSSVREVKTLIDSYRKKYYDARHICFAYSLGPQREKYRVSDDGEPSGTAGRPIFGQIQSYGLTNLLVVVVRYFGGILLGTGGLSLAYKSAAAAALFAAEIIEKTIDTDFNISFEYPFMNDVMHLVKSLGVKVVEQRSEINCMMRLRIRENEAECLENALRKVDSLRFVDEIMQDL
jgi:uncharacterized YigZ family protein